MSLSIRHLLEERHIKVADLSRPGTQIAGIAFRIAQDMEIKSLTPFDISALVEVLELPLRAACVVLEPVSQLSLGVLHILSQKKPLKRNEGTWLAFQVAYLNALQRILDQESRVGRPWLNRADIPSGLEANQPLNDPQLSALLKTLRPGRLSDSQAEQALTKIGESFLVQQMNNAGVAWLVANGAEETEAKLITQRLLHGLPGHLISVIAENPLPLAQLQKFVRVENLAGSGSHPLQSLQDTFTPESEPALPGSPDTFPLDLHRSHYRATLIQALSEPLLAEPFALKDLYVPLKGMPLQESHTVTSSSQTTPNSFKPVDLIEWATAQLSDPTSIAVIEADPGGGKTSFCQIWAAQVAQEMYPSWMPVLIRLRDATLRPTFEQTLDTAFPLGRFTDADGWLSVSHPPCLLILDGLGELSGAMDTGRQLTAFLDQLIKFQNRHSATGQGTIRHKIFLTGTPEALQGLTRKYRRVNGFLQPVQWQRIVIQLMEQEEFRQWFKQWSKLQSKTIAQAYFAFLKQGGVFTARSAVKELVTLARRPLILYLLGILYRDGLIDYTIFRLAHPHVKFEVYDRICRWLLGEPAVGNSTRPMLIREGLAHACRSPEAIANLLHNRRSQDLRHQMQVTALKIWQSGRFKLELESGEQGNLVETQFNPSIGVGSHRSEQGEDSSSNRNSASLTEALPAFFFKIQEVPKEKSQPQTWLEFSHNKLGEYLSAEEIAAQLKALAQQVQTSHGETIFVIPSPVSVAQHLYSLLGYGLLSINIEELAVERLRREAQRNPTNFSFPLLFERLYQFYRAYCRGRWLDERIAHSVHTQSSKNSGLNHASLSQTNSPQRLHNSLNVLQIDAAVGLNVFSLLCAIALEAEIPFWPCGNPQVLPEFDPDQLMTLISRTAVLSPMAFWQKVRQNLSQVQLIGASLNQVMLAEANLWQANLSTAELAGANLTAANLQEANLSWANLAGADLSSANLSGANLTGADLTGANLLRSNLALANLTNACLYQAQLEQDKKHYASVNGAIFSLEEFEAYSRTLVHPKKMVKDKNSTSQDTESILFFIESAEGEPLLPEDWEANSDQEETLLVETPKSAESVLLTDLDATAGADETFPAETPINRS